MLNVEGTIPITRTGILFSAMKRIAPMTAAPPPMSNFISSIASPGFSEMPPVSKVMAFPTRHTVPRGTRRLVLHDDELGRGGGAARHAEEGAHAQLLAVRLLQHLHLEAELAAQALGRLRQVGGGDLVAGAVAELARFVDGVAEAQPSGRALANRLHLGRQLLHHGQLLEQERLGAPIAEVVVVAVEPVEEPLDEGLRHLTRGLARLAAVQHGRRLLHLELAQHSGEGPADAANPFEIERVRLAQPQHHHALGHAPAGDCGIENHGLPRRSLEVPRGEGAGDDPAGRRVHRRGGAGRLLHALVEVHHHHGTADLRDVPLLHAQLELNFHRLLLGAGVVRAPP